MDNLAAETAATMTTKHPDYTILAARIAISNLHKETKKAFSGKYIIIHKLENWFFDSNRILILIDVIEDLYNATNPKTGKWEPLVSKELLDTVKANAHV